MVTPTFEFDAEANGYISEPFTVDRRATVRIELAARAPVLTLKREADGGYGLYGQTPKSGMGFEINVTTNREEVLKLATPVAVTKCYVI